MKKKILIVGSTDRDRQELSTPWVQDQCDIIFHQYDDMQYKRLVCDKIGWYSRDFDAEQLLSDVVRLAKHHRVDGVFSSNDYPGSIIASFVAQQCNLPGPSPQAVLNCHNKFISRQKQKMYVSEAVSFFCLTAKNSNELPLSLPFL